MSRDDFFATVHYEPPPPKAKPPLGMIFAVVGGILLIGGGLTAAWMLGLFDKQSTGSGGIPPAAVKVGKGLPWRSLESYDWVPDTEHPRPSITVADFNRDQAQELLQIDPKGVSKLITVEGKQKELTDAKWKLMSRFTPWDFNRDGVAELVPDAFIYGYVQTPTGYMSVRMKGG